MKITAQNLVDFASNYRADRILPELIRRLIRATSDNIEDVFFPSGESNFRPGADGELQASGKAPHVPDGASIWELSKEQKPHLKGKHDLEKRSAPDAKKIYMGKPRSEITYVAVTLRRWSDADNKSRETFVRDAKLLNVWKDVKVFDADSVEAWLDQTPSVSAWLAREMEIATDDMISLEHWWQHYSQGCSPELIEELLLANRQDKADLLTQKDLTPGVTRVKADSPDEAAGFIAAAILSLRKDDPRRSALLAKTVVISEPSSSRYLTESKSSLLVITMGRAAEIANMLSVRGHVVFTPYGNSHSSSRGSALIELTRARRREFAEALGKMGISEDDARKTATACHCSVTVLRRSLDQAQSARPTWANTKDLRKLLGPLCCGAWDHGSDADNAIVARVANAPYSEIEHAVQDALLTDDAPLLRAGQVTTLSAPADMWQLNIDLKIVDRKLLERLRDAAITVLGEKDPALELPQDKRAYAALYDKRRMYSGWLRQGLTEIIRLIAVNDEKLAYIPGFSPQHFIDSILKDMPGLTADYQMLASLDSLLPNLAEAAPSPFLKALESLMESDGSKLSPIFEGSDDPIFGRTYYLGTLRGLEVLAWDPALFQRTIKILGRMAQLDPGGNLVNRPINSLATIFLPSNPHTNADQQQRHKSLAILCKHFPDIGWNLLVKLLPDGQRLSFSNARPEWREMGASERPVPTSVSINSDLNLFFQLARDLAGTNASRWGAVIKAAGESRNSNQLGELLDEVEVRHHEFVEANQDKQIWEFLTNLTARHENFPTAGWAMPSSILARIKTTINHFSPTDPITLYRHLFTSSVNGKRLPNESHGQRTERCNREREVAIKSISVGGIEAIVRLSREVQVTSLLAKAIVDALSPELCRDVIIATIDEPSPLSWLASLLTAFGATKFGTDWAIEIVDFVESRGTTAHIVASLLKAWDDNHILFEYLASKRMEIQDEYWKLRDTFVRSDDAELVNSAVEKLSSHGRNVELIQFLGGRLEDCSTDLLIRVLSNALHEVVADNQLAKHVDSYWLGQIFDALRKRSDVDRSVLMGLEYNWLPAFHSYGDRHELTLHEHMGQSPEFFVEVLSDLYMADWEVEEDDDESGVESSDDSDNTDEQVDCQKRGKADLAHKVLDTWQKLPWMEDDDSIDYQAMLNWVRMSLTLATEKGRSYVAAREIGRLLAYAPSDSTDELWPTREVRNLIEELSNEHMEASIVSELFNKRGVHSRAMDAGGAPERRLADASKAIADKIQADWPRTSELMRTNAKQWIRQAEWEDRRAAENRIGL